MRIQTITSNPNKIKDEQWRKMDIQRGEKENPPNPNRHPKAIFLRLPSRA